MIRCRGSVEYSLVGHPTSWQFNFIMFVNKVASDIPWQVEHFSYPTVVIKMFMVHNC
jgi:hypothetical protein